MMAQSSVPSYFVHSNFSTAAVVALIFFTFHNPNLFLVACLRLSNLSSENFKYVSQVSLSYLRFLDCSHHSLRLVNFLMQGRAGLGKSHSEGQFLGLAC